MNTLIKPPCTNTPVNKHLAAQNPARFDGFIYISGAISLHELFYCAVTVTPTVKKEQLMQLMQLCKFSMITEYDEDSILPIMRNINNKMLNKECKITGVLQAMPPCSGDLYAGGCSALLSFCKTANFALVFNPMPKSQYNSHSVYEEEFDNYDDYRTTNILVAEALGTYAIRNNIVYHTGMKRTASDTRLKHFRDIIKPYT